MSDTAATIAPLTPDLLPALGATWQAQRSRARPGQPDESGRWVRPLPERRAIVERALRASLGAGDGRALALAAVRGETVAAYLIGREVRLPRTASYRAYAPDRFVSVAADDWGVAAPGDRDLLADLYAELTTRGLARGVAAHLLAIAPGDDCADLWLDLGFARQDRYAFLPLDAARPGPPGPAVRRAGSADLDLATAFVLAEARHHQGSPIYAFAPPGLAAGKRRDMAENLADPAAFVLIAEDAGQPLGAISAFLVPGLPSWMPTSTPTPCAYIDSAFVHPAARGRGLLRALVVALAAAVAPSGARGLFVTYLPANRGAARAWVGLGFRPLLTIHQRRLDPRAVRQHRPG